jgi:hypothetical protein
MAPLGFASGSLRDVLSFLCHVVNEKIYDYPRCVFLLLLLTIITINKINK